MLNIQNNINNNRINAILAHNAGIIYPFKKAVKPPYSDEKTRLYDNLMEWIKSCDGQPVTHALKCDTNNCEFTLCPTVRLDAVWILVTDKAMNNIVVSFSLPCTSNNGRYAANDEKGIKRIKADGIIARIKAEKANHIDAMTAKTANH